MPIRLSNEILLRNWKTFRADRIFTLDSAKSFVVSRINSSSGDSLAGVANMSSMTMLRPIDLSNVTLAVLAGGSGSRMGVPKARMQLLGKPILEWVLKRMDWPGPTMLVSAPAVVHPPGFEFFDREVVDPIDGLGPLQGILTALNHLSTPLSAVVTVDMPHVIPSVLAWLVDYLALRPLCNGVMCRVKAGVAERIEPFPSVLARTPPESSRGGWRRAGDLFGICARITHSPRRSAGGLAGRHLGQPEYPGRPGEI